MHLLSREKRKRPRLLAIARSRQCPFCLECDWMRRDWYHWYDLLFVLFALRPFRCLSCWSRIYVLSWEMRSDLPSKKEAR